MKWLENMDDYSFYSIYELMKDFERELNISPNKIAVPLEKHRLHFAITCPNPHYIKDQREFRKTRLKLLELLKTKKIIKRYSFSSERYPSEVNIVLSMIHYNKLMAALKENDIKRKEVNKSTKSDIFWNILHPSIAAVARSRFSANNYADSIEASFKEIEQRIKQIVKKRRGSELTGVNLMKKAFDENAPIIPLADISTNDGKSTQKGYKRIFAGCFGAIRNPKAHINIHIDAKRAIHLLILTSYLMSKVSEEV